MTSTFEQDTAAEPLGDGRYRVAFHPRWWVLRGPNGGIVAAAIVRAMEAEVADPGRALRTITIHFPSAPREGEAILRVHLMDRSQESGQEESFRDAHRRILPADSGQPVAPRWRSSE